MKPPVRKFVFGLLAGLAVATQTRAALVLNESFSYPDGSLTAVSSGVWSNHSGTALQLDVRGGKVNLTQSESEDVNTLLEGEPYASGHLYAAFVVNFSTAPTGAGSYFAHLKDATATGFRGRVFAAATGAAAGKYRVGIANGTGTPLFIDTDLDLSSNYLVVVRYDTATAASTLWINPGSEAAIEDRADATDTPSAPAITAFALRQAAGMGVLTLDDLKVGTTFNDVVGGGDPTRNPPSLSRIPGQNIPANTATPAVPFTVHDGETPAGNLVLSGSSSNPSLVADDGISFGGSDADRTVTVTPLGSQQGSAVITVTVADGDNNTASRSFLVVVGAPTLASVNNQTTPINTAAPVPIVVRDPESDPLNLSAISTNETLVPASNITFEGTGANRVVNVVPAAGVSGLTRITVFVTDGFNAASNSFLLTVFPTGGVDFTETFDYPDGPVTTNSLFRWNTHSAGLGQTGQTQVVQGKLLLSGGQSEDINAFFASPFAPSGGWILYARFVVNFSARPGSAAGDYFAHFRNAGLTFGERVFAVTSGAGAGKVRLGIANNTGSPSAVLPLDLETNRAYTVVTRYNVGTGESALWVDPGSENDPAATATDAPSPFEVFSYAFRQSAGIGSMTIDDLKIGASFAEVASGVPPLLAIARKDDGIEISWTTNSLDFLLQSSPDASNPVLWQEVGEQPSMISDRYVLSIATPTGNLFYRLRKGP